MAYGYELTIAYPVLDKLAELNIFSIGLSNDKSLLTMEENCDNHFRTTLTKDEVLQLAAELVVIADSMIEGVKI